MSEQKAKDLMSVLSDSPDSFEKLAQENSTCPSGKKGGDLGTFSKRQMVKEFEDVCFADDVVVGKIYGPVKTQFGFHLIKVTSSASKKSN